MDPVIGSLAVAAFLCAALGFGVGRRLQLPEARGGERARESAYVRLLEYAAVAANEATTLEEAMDEGVRRICLAMDWAVGRIHVVEAEGTLQLAGVFFPDEDAELARPTDSMVDAGGANDESLAERALKSGCPEWLGGPEASSCPRVSGRGIHTAIAIPVLTGQRVAAVLEFGMRERLVPDARLLEVLALVGVQIGRVAERSAMAQRIRQAQKLEAIGRLSAGVAHEINNPMAFVRSNLNQLASEWKRLRSELAGLREAAALSISVGECEELLEETIEGVERTVSIVRDMKEFSHIGGDGRVPTDLREVVDTALRVASSHAPVGVALQRRDDPDLTPVLCCPNQMIQVLVNLIVNAIEAASPSGRVEVVTCREEGMAVIQVEDTGPGMSAETRERLFEPFFTTKAAGEGTGLGLAISYEIIRNHDGEIRVISAEGAGTVMEVRLPLGTGMRAPGSA